MSSIRVEITQQECDMLEGLQVELEGQKSLIAFMFSTQNPYTVDESKLSAQMTKYNKLFASHQVLMDKISTEHLPKDFEGKLYDYNIVFNDRTITYTLREAV